MNKDTLLDLFLTSDCSVKLIDKNRILEHLKYSNCRRLHSESDIVEAEDDLFIPREDMYE